MDSVVNTQANDRSESGDYQESDVWLWGQILNGDQQAFEKIVVRYQGVVSAVAFSHVGNFAWCQEVTQETFWQAWRQRKDLSDHHCLAAWLRGIARNLARQTYRHERGPGVVPLLIDPPRNHRIQ